ncbi:MAG: hypothetical protein JO112_10815 [Planctomycetes bacterium]|nr:hypothetical protein [Planctomycetota bacterium]
MLFGRKFRSGPLTKVAAKTAAEVCRHFPLGKDAGKLLQEDLTPSQFLDLLVEKKLYLDALRFLAHALPKAEAVRWACLCTRSVLGPQPEAPSAAALQAAEQWVAEPSEENRRAAQATAAAAGYDTPAGCAAMAAFWSGGSLGPPNTPVIPPGEYLTSHGAWGAVLLAALVPDPGKTEKKHYQFLSQGIELANHSSGK